MHFDIILKLSLLGGMQVTAAIHKDTPNILQKSLRHRLALFSSDFPDNNLFTHDSSSLYIAYSVQTFTYVNIFTYVIYTYILTKFNISTLLPS